MRIMMFLTIITLLTMSMAKSNEMDTDKRNPGKDKVDYVNCEDKESWFEKNWCETVEYQKQGWAQGKKDLAKTKVDLQNLPANAVTFVKETPTNVSNFVKDTGNGISNWASKEWNSIKEYQKETWSK
jgi:hypothetical protein